MLGLLGEALLGPLACLCSDSDDQSDRDWFSSSDYHGRQYHGDWYLAGWHNGQCQWAVGADELERGLNGRAVVQENFALNRGILGHIGAKFALVHSSNNFNTGVLAEGHWMRECGKLRSD